MPSYQPVDLSAACNAGLDVLGDEPGDVPLGRVDLRGLPFLIGSQAPSAERVLPAAARAPADPSVAIGRLAPRVIVAHRLLEPGGRPATPSGSSSPSTASTWPAARSSPRRSGSGSRSRSCRRGGAASRSWPSPTPATTRCAVRGQLGRVRDAAGGARDGRPGRLLPVVLGESRARSTSRADRVRAARPPLHRRRRHHQRRRRAPVRAHPDPPGARWWRKTGAAASSTSTWTAGWRPTRSRCPARTTGPAGGRPTARPRTRRSPRCRRPPSPSAAATTSSAGSAGATWSATGRPTRARSALSWSRTAATGCT